MTNVNIYFDQKHSDLTNTLVQIRTVLFLCTEAFVMTKTKGFYEQTEYIIHWASSFDVSTLCDSHKVNKIAEFWGYV